MRSSSPVVARHSQRLFPEISVPLILACAAVVASAQQVPPTGRTPLESGLPEMKQATVSVPWGELRPLLDRALRDPSRTVPVDYVFSEATYAATVTGDRAGVIANVQVSTLAPGWTLVPLGPADSGISSVKADDKACQLVMREKSLFALFDQPGRHALEIRLEQPVQQTASEKQFQLQLLPAPLVSLTVTAPGDVQISAEGATQGQVEDGEAEDATIWSATCRGGQAVAVSIRKAPVADRVPRIYAETGYLVVVDDGLVRVTLDAALDVAQAPIKQLPLRVDPRAVVLDVAGPGVAGFSDELRDGSREITATFARPVSGKVPLRVVFEIDTNGQEADLTLTTAEMPTVRREQGVIAVVATEAVQIADVTSDAQRMSVSRLPAPLRAAAPRSPELAFRYAQAAASLALKVRRPEPQQPKIIVRTDTLVSIGATSLKCRANVQYEILHAGVDALRIGLPAEVDVRSITAPGLRRASTIEEEGERLLVLDMKDLVEDRYELTLAYSQPLADHNEPADVPLITHPDAEADRGSVGVEVRSNWEVEPVAENLERVDVKELPPQLWESAVSPILIGYQYDAQPARLALQLTRNRDLDVLVAFSDVCEASTVVTPDGKAITKLMYITRNNLKPFLTLDLPPEAELWSALVDDRPVTPARNAKGQVLIPLKKSDEVDEDDEDSYRARRERRRSQRIGEARVLREEVKRLEVLEEEDGPRDLKPYDVELVFVSPSVELGDRGTVDVQLPRCDVPAGHLAWAVFLPSHLGVVDTEGTVQEVQSFTLPFRHFGEAAYLQSLAAREEAVEQLARAQKQLAEQADAIQELAREAKAEGVLPVRVQIPITGQIYRFQKFLVVDDAPQATLHYRRKVD